MPFRSRDQIVAMIRKIYGSCHRYLDFVKTTALDLTQEQNSKFVVLTKTFKNIGIPKTIC